MSPFLNNADIPTSKMKHQEILSDPPNNHKLYMELEWSHLVKLFSLEGDGPLIFKACEKIALLSAWALNQHYPNTKYKDSSQNLTTTPSQPPTAITRLF